MIVLLARIVLALAGAPSDVADEQAHVLCEQSVASSLQLPIVHHMPRETALSVALSMFACRADNP